MTYKCQACKKKFKEQKDLNQHIHAKHFNYPLMVDEMLSGNEPECLQLRKQGQKIIKFPYNLKGKPDHVILNYIKEKCFGLITKDKQFARKANSICSK